MADSTAETTPLLAGEDHEAQAPEAAAEQYPTQIPASARFPRTVKFLTTTSFAVSVVTLILGIATFAVVKAGPFGYGAWQTTENIVRLGWLVRIPLSLTPSPHPIDHRLTNVGLPGAHLLALQSAPEMAGCSKHNPRSVPCVLHLAGCGGAGFCDLSRLWLVHG